MWRERKRKGERGLTGPLVLMLGGIISDDVSTAPTRKGSKQSSQIHDDSGSGISMYVSCFVARTLTVQIRVFTGYL